MKLPFSVRVKKNSQLFGCFIAVMPIMSVSSRVCANQANPAIPEEYETTGGQSLAFGGSVASGFGGVSAVRSNPALLAMDKEYAVSGSYHWPAAGRDFYQLGIVDSKTSSIAAGFSYTGAMEDYQGVATGSQVTTPGVMDLSKDSPVVRRASLAFAVPVGRFFAGVGGALVEAQSPAETLTEDGSQKIKGFTLGFGLAAQLSSSLRLGVSAENLANRKVRFAAPTFYRAAASYSFADVASINIDWRRRENIDLYEGVAPALFTANATPAETKSVKPENFMNVSTSVKVYDLLRLIAATGQLRSETQTTTRIAGGLALVNGNFNFSYQALKPDALKDSVHHSLALALDVAI